MFFLSYKKKKKIGPDCSLYRQMLDSYKDSVAPGTLNNRMRQAKSFVKFSVLYNFDPLQPTDTHLCMYAQFLKNSHSSPQSVKNYLSGAKTWVAEHGGLTQPFLSRDLDQLTKGFVKNSNHVPMRAAPLNVNHLFMIAEYVQANPFVPRSVLPCIIIGFKCFLRSSNLLSPSTDSWGGPHTLLSRDITLLKDSLLISIRSTKSKSDNRPEIFSLEKELDSRLCPVRLWTEYVRAVNPWAYGPAFLTNDLRPLTARHVVVAMRAALDAATDLDPGRVSLHSLRRGAAQDALEKGLPLPQIKTLGLWKSDSGIKPYLDSSSHIFKP